MAYVREEVFGLLDGSLEEEGQLLIYWLDESAARRTGKAIGSFFLPEFGPHRLQFLRDAISCYEGVKWKAAKPEQEGSGSNGPFWASSPFCFRTTLFTIVRDHERGAGVGAGHRA